MHSRVVLTALRGLGVQETFVFDTPTCCVLGRASDCGLRVPNDDAHRAVSRHHCLLAIDPPNIWICDLGSRNGTYVNAVKIGYRPPDAPPEADALPPRDAHALEEGDAIQAGNVLLTVHVFQGVGLSVCEAPNDGAPLSVVNAVETKRPQE